MPRTTLLFGSLMLMGFPINAEAQSRELPNKPVCSPTASVVSIRVHGAEGKAVPGTILEMHRVRDNTALGRAVEMRAGSGEFALFESEALAWVNAKGDSIQLRASAAGQSAAAVVVIGRDKTGCRIAKLAGPDSLVLK